MHSHIQHYGPDVIAVSADANPGNTNLVSLRITEKATESWITVDRATWQQVADTLANLGIIAAGATRTVPSSAQTVRHASEVSA